MEYHNHSAHNLDFLRNDEWPKELRLLVAEHLAPKDLLSCRAVCQTWLDALKDELFWKNKIPSSLASYSYTVNGEYYRLFTRGGVHLIQTFDHLKLFMIENDANPKYMWPLHRIQINKDLGFCYSRIPKDLVYAQKYANNIMMLACPYLAKPTKIFSEYLVFDNEIEQIGDVIKEEEYSEKFVIGLVRQLIQTVKYWKKFAGIGFGIRRTSDCNIRLQLVNTVTKHHPPSLILAPYYEAPEVMVGTDYDPRPSFSFGAVVLCLLTGSTIFNLRELRAIVEVRKLEKYEVQDPQNELSSLAKDFLNRLMDTKSNRMKLEEALMHPWLTNPDPSMAVYSMTRDFFTRWSKILLPFVSMEKHEKDRYYSPLDFFGDEQWPNELRLFVVQHLSPKDLILCRVICKEWLNSLNNQIFWKTRIPYGLSNYFPDVNGNYYQLFVRGGVHLIKTLEQLKNILSADHPHQPVSFLHKINLDADLGFLYMQTRMRHYNTEPMEVIRKFMNEICSFDCPYLAKPTKYFEDEEDFFLVFDNQLQDLFEYIDSVPLEEYNEKLVIKWIRQAICAMKYLHDRNLFLFTRFGTLGLCVKQNYNGEIHLKFVNYCHNWYAVYAPIVYPGQFLSPDMAGDRDNISYTVKSEMFSLGTLTKLLLTGEALYDIHPLRLMMQLSKFSGYKIQDPNNELSDLAKDFMMRLWRPNPDDRMTLEEALNHPWLTNPHPSTSPLSFNANNSEGENE